MADRKQLEQALKQADAAGDTEAAAKLANALRSMGTAAPSRGDEVRAEFDKLPLWMKPVQAAMDIARIGGDAASMGFTDPLRSLLLGGDVEQHRQNTSDARERAGLAGDLMAAGSAAAPALLTAGATLPAAGGNILKTALAGLEGAGWGGLDALGHGEDVKEGQMYGAAFGAIGNVAGRALSSSFDTIAQLFSPKPPRSNPRQARLEKDRAYNAVEDEGVRYTPKAMDDLVADLDDVMRDSWPSNQPRAQGAHQRARRDLPGYRTPLEVDQQRQAIRRDARDPAHKSEGMFGGRMTKAVDDWMSRPKNQSDVTSWSGDPEKVAGLLDDARAKAFKVEKIDEIDERIGKAERAADRNLYSGADSTLKTNIGRILDDPEARSKYSADELEQMNVVNSGTGYEKFMRQAGRMAPGGGLSLASGSAAFGLGATLGGPVIGAMAAAVPSVLGMGAKKLSERATRKEAEKLLDMVATGPSAYRRFKVPKVLNARSEKELAEVLMMLGITADE